MNWLSARHRAAVVVVLAAAIVLLLQVTPRPGKGQVFAPPHQRVVTVEVVDATGAAVPDAPVEAIGGYRPRANSKTDAHGLAVLQLNPDQPVQWIIGLRSHKGLDYFENYHTPGHNVFLPASARELPERVKLILDGARAVRIHAVDDFKASVPGVRFVPWLLCKRGRTWNVNLSGSGIASETTDANGVATFDWLPSPAASAPREEAGVTFLAADDHFDWPDPPDRVPYASDGIELTAHVSHNGTISGKVLLPEGRAASGIRVVAEGRGNTLQFCCQSAVTSADGTYVMRVSADQVYMIAVADDNWTAATRAGMEIRPGEARTNVNFALSKGVLVRGRVIGLDGHGMAGNLVFLRYKGPPLADIYRGPARELDADAALVRQAVSGFDGSYRFRIPPGEYGLAAAAGVGRDAMHFALNSIQVGEQDVIMDLSCKRNQPAYTTASIVKANHGEPYDFSTLRVKTQTPGSNDGCVLCHRPFIGGSR